MRVLQENILVVGEALSSARVLLPNGQIEVVPGVFTWWRKCGVEVEALPTSVSKSRPKRALT